ncbi:flagellar biosynthesis protein FlhF [Bacillus massilinigeriensis]|uniref:flagellar biosynthesis protein FlhF n=1 Tax=Bacillus mediterraneensis TaxID=1805474 RepID=UPI0008F9205C|nr:flagellar biosynthesis protein FlhF [Bacillus mediterraneensis]
MKIKKFSAPTMPEAMKLVREELGKDAVILNSRVLKSDGFLGLFKKTKIELLAAVEPKDEEYAPYKKGSTILSKEMDVERIGNAVKKQNFPQKEIEADTTKSADFSLYPPPIKDAARMMEEQELCSQVVIKVLSALLERFYQKNEWQDFSDIRMNIAFELEKMLSEKALGGLTFKRKFIMVAGPTGVGKTTTLAKIAAESMLKYDKKIAFITTDTYRIGAIEQLKTYAGILDVPIEVCYSMADFKHARDRFNEYDHIFIDTAGRNFRNEKYVKDLREAVDFDANLETFLVLSLTSKERDMIDICNRFSSIPIDKFIFTKADETYNYGSILNMLEKFPYGVAYITNGQDVPDDLIEASPGRISMLIAKAGETFGSS